MTVRTPRSGGVALVTGASSGIGEEISRELSRRGYELVLVARSAERLAVLAAGLPTAAHVFAVDLADRDARVRLVQDLRDRGLSPGVLVNNAGFSTLGPVHRSDPEEELRLVEVDVAAVVDLCSRLLPDMVEQGSGAVLNVASTAAFQPLPGQAAYGAAKSFVLSYTRSLAAELKGTGVTASALCPGPVATGFGEAAGFTKEQADEALPGFLWVSASAVARTAVDGMEKGTVVVVPGLANRAGAALGHLLPKRVLTPLLARKHPGLS